MPAPIIKVENVSKSFIISHEGKERYTSLRDVLSQKAKRLFSPSQRNDQSNSSEEEFWALKDVNFEIQQGDRVGIIGRNGAGKSTLLKVLSRITDPTKGRIEINGRIASLLEVGTGFHPELTGRENIFLNGAILGMSRAEIRKKFDEIVAFAEVEQFLDTPVKRYSSGMYVRLAFAVAAHLEPEILIVDEVLAVGDVQFQKKCIGKMNDVSQNEGRTVLFVSHQMDTIEMLTNKCVYLKGGIINEFGNTSDVISTYLNDFKKNEEIKHFKDRIGNGKVKVIKIEIRKNEKIINGIKQGDEFEILFGIDVKEKNLALDMSIAIENQRHQALFCSQLSDLSSTLRKDSYFEISILVDSPKLRTGDYLISVALYKPDQSEFYDVVNHFNLVTVEGVSEHFAMPIDSRVGNLYFPLKWSLSNE